MSDLTPPRPPRLVSLIPSVVSLTVSWHHEDPQRFYVRLTFSGCDDATTLIFPVGWTFEWVVSVTKVSCLMVKHAILIFFAVLSEGRGTFSLWVCRIYYCSSQKVSGYCSSFQHESCFLHVLPLEKRLIPGTDRLRHVVRSDGSWTPTNYLRKLPTTYSSNNVDGNIKNHLLGRNS